jgi:hypothetical protein
LQKARKVQPFLVFHHFDGDEEKFCRSTHFGWENAAWKQLVSSRCVQTSGSLESGSWTPIVVSPHKGDNLFA